MYVSWSLYLAPISSVLMGTLPLLCFRRSLKLLGIAAAAYFTAIAAKVAIETAFRGFFSSAGIATFVAYGVLTCVFEGGLAFAFISIFRQTAVSDVRSGLFYGLSLSFWENTVLMGFLVSPFNIINLAILPFLPASLLPPGAAAIFAINYMPLLLPHVFDRITSATVHVMFGFMTYASVRSSDLRRLLLVMPLGMIDSIATWWDFNRSAMSYLDISLIMLVTAVVASLVILTLSRELGNFRLALKQEFLFSRR